MISKVRPTKILTKRGYAIVKSEFELRELHRCRKDLTVKPFINSGYGVEGVPYPIYLESKKKLYLPKFYGFEHFGDPDIIKISKGADIDVEFKGSLRDKQHPVVDAFLHTCSTGKHTNKSNGGIVSVPCGWGKTIMALYIISKLNKKTIIVVHKEFLLNQWRERIAEFLPDARVGIIQGPKIDVEGKDIVLAMLQSLSVKDYPAEIFNEFGFSVVDECHHIAAEVFSRALPKINSYYSLGLSATPNRADGMTKVFKMFLGPIVYKTDADDKCVEVRVVDYNEPHNLQYIKEELTFTKKLCLPRMINNIANNPNRNLLIVKLAKSLVDSNKQTIILSDRRAQLKLLHGEISEFATVGYYVGGMKQKAREESMTKQVILATFHIAREALDIKSLNVLFLATPKSDIIQAVGRILRDSKINNHLIVDFVDNFSSFANQAKRRLTYFRKKNYNIKTFEIEEDGTITNSYEDDYIPRCRKKKSINKEPPGPLFAFFNK